MIDQDRTRDLRSYGRRRGRKPSERQARLLRELLPRLAVDLSAPCGLPAKAGIDEGESHGAKQGSPSGLPLIAPASGGRLPGGESPDAIETWLEIGFGGGEHLLWQARANPGVGLIGCEPFEDGVVKVLSAIEDEALRNVRIHMDDARDLLRALPPGALSRAFILFPDPWPKRKHQKRRLVSAATLNLLAQAMKPDAELRIATDIGDYARSALEAIYEEGSFAWRARRPCDWRARPCDWPETRYEAKAASAGRKRYYFSFFRV